MCHDGSSQHVNGSRSPKLASIEKRIQELEASTLFIYNAVLYITEVSTLRRLDCNGEKFAEEIRNVVVIVDDELGEDEDI